MKYFIFFFFTPLFLSYAQSDSLIISDFEDFVSTSLDFYTSPLRFDSEDWIKLSAVIGITGIAALVDKDIKKFSQKNLNNFTNGVFSIDKYYYTQFVGASIVAFYGYGLLVDNTKVRKLAVKLTEATFLAGSITLVTKIVIGRSRPYKQESQYYTNPFTFDNDYNSFPSGHTTLAFAYSTVMANEVDNVFWKIGWYSLAGLVGYSRIHHNQHWLSDVLMGTAIGYFSGEFVNNHESKNNESSSIRLYPLPMGFAVQIVF
ncbi:MAG: phosphatase PAP2 family protein [Ignavibacteria bacterium]|nr:phosphatase PAP2 family protein [Ignavibacteria bacterium]